MWPDLSAYNVAMVRVRRPDESTAVALTGDPDAVRAIRTRAVGFGFDERATRDEAGLRWRPLMRVLPEARMAPGGPPAAVSLRAVDTEAASSPTVATSLSEPSASDKDRAPGNEAADIEDFGAVIGGARKHLAALNEAGMGLLSRHVEKWTPEERIELATRDRLWPRLDYAKRMGEGVPREVVYVIDKIRSMVSPTMTYKPYRGNSRKPIIDGEEQMEWATAVSGIGRLLNKASSMDAVREIVRTHMIDVVGWDDEEHHGYRRLGMRHHHHADGRTWDYSLIFKKRSSALRELYHATVTNAEDRWAYAARQDAEAAWRIPAAAGGASNRRRAMGRGTSSRVKRRLETLERNGGEDWRQGTDATTELFQETFGFRGGQWGNWQRTQKERQQVLNHAYDAFMDLAAVLDLPPKALALDGNLAVAFGARGRGGRAAAHYEPGQKVINLTRIHGAGSLAHEWFHALDHYLAYSAVARPGPGKDHRRHVVDDRVSLLSLQYGIKIRSGARSRTMRWDNTRVGLRAMTEENSRHPGESRPDRPVPEDAYFDLVSSVHWREGSLDEAEQQELLMVAWVLDSAWRSCEVVAKMAVSDWLMELADDEQRQAASRCLDSVALDMLHGVESVGPAAEVRGAFVASRGAEATDLMTSLHQLMELDPFDDMDTDRRCQMVTETVKAFIEDNPRYTEIATSLREGKHSGDPIERLCKAHDELAQCLSTRSQRDTSLEKSRTTLKRYAEQRDRVEAGGAPAGAVIGDHDMRGVTAYFGHAKKHGSYWKRPHELLARAFETYVYDRLQDKAVTSPYLVSAVSQLDAVVAPITNVFTDLARVPGRMNKDYFRSAPSDYPQLGDRVWLNHRFDQLFRSLEYTETDSGVALYSLRETPVDIGDGMQPKQVAGIVDGWGLKGNVQVVVVPSAEDLPGPNHPTNARALAKPESNEVWLVAGNLSSHLEVQEAFMEEAVHVGLRHVMGDRLAPVLREIAADNELVSAKAEQLVEAYARAGVRLDATAAVEEALGHLAAEGRVGEVQGFAKFVSEAKGWMRDHGMSALAGKWTDDDVGVLLAKSVKQVFESAPTTAPERQRDTTSAVSDTGKDVDDVDFAGAGLAGPGM